MVKLIIFDLDGVLIDFKDIHYNCLNSALKEYGDSIGVGDVYSIAYEQHLNEYDGLNTRKKLMKLSESRGLPLDSHDFIFDLKQYKTLMHLATQIHPIDDSVIRMLTLLKSSGVIIACCSNSIHITIETALENLGIRKLIDIVVGNDDVKSPKPHPEVYWTAMIAAGVDPSHTVVFEDSPVGLYAASSSSARVVRTTVKDLVSFADSFETVYDIESIAEKKILPKWVNKKMNVLIPMAGAGSRFQQQGYTFPKPLIEVNGSPMIKVALDCLGIDANFIFIVQESHRSQYNLDSMLNLIVPNCTIISSDGLTNGAACSTLLAKNHIDNDSPLLISNSDQFIEWDSWGFFYSMHERNVDGGIVTFHSTHPKWSFVRLNENGYIEEVAEKNPISDMATAGVYYWKHGSEYVRYAEQMIEKDIRTNNEFYVCPVFNEAIQDGKRIVPYTAKSMWGLGTPEDLRYFVNNYKE
jgi:HAD superfamily hydrolase (TIGR01509 family)